MDGGPKALNSCFQDESLTRKRLSRISSQPGFQTASVMIEINTRCGCPPPSAAECCRVLRVER